MNQLRQSVYVCDLYTAANCNEDLFASQAGLGASSCFRPSSMGIKAIPGNSKPSSLVHDSRQRSMLSENAAERSFER